MNLATLICAVAALLQLSFGATFLIIARAPGWARAKLFALLALSAAAYSAVNTLLSLSSPGWPAERLQMLNASNYLIGSLHCSAWLVYTFADPERPLSALLPRYQRLVAFTVLLGLLAQIPGVALTAQIQVISVPLFNVIYYLPETTVFGSVLGAYLVLVLLLPFGVFLRAARGGDLPARERVLGFGLFFLCALVEVLVANRVVTFLFPADIGFLSIVMVIEFEVVRQVIADARRLDQLGKSLSAEVVARTRELDDTRQALIHADRLASIGQLAAGVGHEVNNPLMLVQLNLNELKLEHQALLPKESLERLEEALEGTERIKKVVAGLRSYSLPEPDQRQTVPISRVLDSALQVAAHRLRHVAKVRQEHGPTDPVRVDPVRLSQVFVNLLVNAAQAVSDAKREKPEVLIRSRMSGPGRVMVEVIDNGVGIPPEFLRRLSEPYFSTRMHQGGSGLGLFTARGILASIDGLLEFESTVGVQTLARVIVPSAREDASAAVPETETEVLQPSADPQDVLRGARVLVVDDEPLLARSVGRMLRGARVTTAGSGDEALGLLLGDSAFDLVLCDLMMPGKSGMDVHRELMQARPELGSRVLFMTGGAVTPTAEAFVRRPGVRHLTKPFSKQKLLDALNAAARR